CVILASGGQKLAVATDAEAPNRSEVPFPVTEGVICLDIAQRQVSPTIRCGCLVGVGKQDEVTKLGRLADEAPQGHRAGLPYTNFAGRNSGQARPILADGNVTHGAGVAPKDVRLSPGGEVPEDDGTIRTAGSKPVACRAKFQAKH